jgi:hypothetical protein
VSVDLAKLRAELEHHDQHVEVGVHYWSGCGVCNPEDLELHIGADDFAEILRVLLEAPAQEKP